MKRTVPSLMIALLALGATSQPALSPPPSYDCGRARGAIVVDGVLDDAAWTGAPWTADFVDIVGTGDRPAPALRTRAKLLWDDAHLYVAAELTEPQVAATIEKRDEQLYKEQAFELFLDPGADGTNYLELQINPLNTVCDLSMTRPYGKGGKANVAFDLAGLRTAVRVKGTVNHASDVDEGWTVELAIPWAAVKSPSADTVAPPPPRGGEAWRVNVARMRTIESNGADRATVRRDMSAWSPQGAVNMHLPERWGTVRFTAHP